MLCNYSFSDHLFNEQEFGFNPETLQMVLLLILIAIVITLWCVSFCVILCRLNSQDRTLTRTEKELEDAKGALDRATKLLDAGSCLAQINIEYLETKLAVLREQLEKQDSDVQEKSEIDEKDERDQQKQEGKKEKKTVSNIFQKSGKLCVSQDMKKNEKQETIELTVVNKINDE